MRGRTGALGARRWRSAVSGEERPPRPSVAGAAVTERAEGAAAMAEQPPPCPEQTAPDPAPELPDVSTFAGEVPPMPRIRPHVLCLPGAESRRGKGLEEGKAHPPASPSATEMRVAPSHPRQNGDSWTTSRA